MVVLDDDECTTDKHAIHRMTASLLVLSMIDSSGGSFSLGHWKNLILVTHVSSCASLTHICSDQRRESHCQRSCFLSLEGHIHEIRRSPFHCSVTFQGEREVCRNKHEREHSSYRSCKPAFISTLTPSAYDESVDLVQVGNTLK